MSNNYRSNTMELDSIMQEARNRRNAAASRSDAGSRQQPVKNTRPARNFNEDFVVTKDDDTYVDAATYRPYNDTADRGGQSDPRRKSKTGMIVVISVVCVLLLVGVAGLAIFLNSGSGTGPNSTFSDNVYVNGKSLKDLNMEQARALLAPVEEDLANQINVTVKAGDKSYTLTKNDLKYTFDTEQVLAEAKKYSEDKGFKTEAKKYEIKLTVDENSCKDAVNKIAGEASTEAKDATVTKFDPSADNMFTIAEEQKGTKVDEDATLSSLNGLFKQGNLSGTVDATVTEVSPKITKSYLAENIVELSHFSTYSSNNSNGNENMRISLAACNGSIIEPGETWSFNACTGDSNQESNGYLPAGVIVEGRSETGIGGGICQSSTTIYNAGILCGMDVVERECHYYQSVYVDAGRDATIDYGNIDLKLSNPFKYQLFMKCWMDGTELNCTIYGLQNENFDRIEISTTDPDYFSNGYTVHTTRTYYKGDKKVDSDELPSSTYYTSAPSSGSSDNSGSDSSSSSSSSTPQSQEPVDNPDPPVVDPDPPVVDPDPPVVDPDPPVVDPNPPVEG